jgi:exodeoxyribonuclease X
MTEHSAVIVDVETTGLDPRVDRVVEIAAVFVGPRGGIRRVVQSLIQPDRRIPPAASAIHHLTDEHVEGAPRLREILEIFDLRSAEVLVAHNLQFDAQFVGHPEHGDPTLLEMPQLCTLRAARRLFRDADSHSNQALRYHLGLPAPADGEPHRAKFDAMVTAALLARMLRERSLEELLELQSTELIQEKVSFGQNRGRPWSEMDPGFLSWVLARNFEPDVMSTARHWLDKKRRRA